MAPVSSNRYFDIHGTIQYGFTLKCLCGMTRTYSQMHRTDKYSQHSSIIWPVWLNVWVFVYELSVVGLSPIGVTLTSGMAHVSSKKYLDFQVTIKCEFNLKRLHDMTRTYSQMQCTDNYSQHNSIIWPVWLNSWVFFDELGVVIPSSVEVT